MDTLVRPGDGPPEQCPACGGEAAFQSEDSEGDTLCPHCGNLLWFVRKRCNGIVVLTFLPGLTAGEEALGKVHQVQEAAANTPRLILNLSRMRLISSMFLGMLVVIHRQTRASNGTMKLCGLHADALEVFRVTKLDALFDICADEPTALGSFFDAD